MSRYLRAIEDGGDAGFFGYLGGGRFQADVDLQHADRHARVDAVRAMLQFMPADEDCPPHCAKCQPPRLQPPKWMRP